MGEEYKLSTLLDVRERELDAAEEAYAAELRALRRCEGLIEQKRGDLEAARARRDEDCRAHDARRFAGGMALAEERVFGAHLQALKRDEALLLAQIAQAQRALKAQEVVVAQAKRALIEATQALKAVQKHRENWELARRIARARRETAAMDEVAARLWMERQR